MNGSDKISSHTYEWDGLFFSLARLYESGLRIGVKKEGSNERTYS